MRTIALPVACLAVSLVLAACTVPGGTTSPSTGAAAASSTAAPTSASAPADGRPSDVDQLMNDEPTRPINVQWPVIAGADGMTAAMKAWVGALGTAFLAENAPSETAPPELQGTWELLRRGPGIVSVRLHLYDFAGASGQNYSRTFYGDTASGAGWTASDLIKADQQDAAVSAVLAALRASGKEPFDDPVDADRRTKLLQDLTFDASGGLVVRLPQGLVLPYSDGQVQVTVPAATASGLLTADGVRLAGASAGAVGTPLPSRPADAPEPSGADTPTASSTSPAAQTSAPQTSTSTQAPEPADTSSQPAASGVDCAKLTCVALTFDDGPSRYTASILDTLDAAGVKATFFELGQSASVYPAVVKRQVASGMVIGNHTLDHKQLTKLSPGQQASEVSSGASRLMAAGAPKPTWFRPPYGSYNAATRGLGVPIVLWDVDSEDWKNKDAAATTALIMKETRRGSIILMHDIWPSTAQALPGIIAKLKAQGYTLVTLPELVGQPVAGRVYHGQNR